MEIIYLSHCQVYPLGELGRKCFSGWDCQKRIGIGWGWERGPTKRRKAGSTSSVFCSSPGMGVVWEKSPAGRPLQGWGWAWREAITEGRKESENCLLFLGFPLFSYISVFIKVSSGQWTMFCSSRHNYLIQLPPEGNLHSIATHLQWTKYKKWFIFFAFIKILSTCLYSIKYYFVFCSTWHSD